MIRVKLRHEENIVSLFRRFKRAVMNEGLLREMRRTEYYEKPSDKMRQKRHQARRRAIEAQMLADAKR